MSRDHHDPFGEEAHGGRGPGSAVLAAVAVLLVCTAGWLAWERMRPGGMPLTAARGRLTLAEETGERPMFDPRETPEIWYRVVLAEAPLGAAARLVGECIDPTGHVVQRNAYDTRPISHLPWETHVRFRLPADAVPGTWRVRLVSAGRELHALSFEVGAGSAGKEAGP